MLLMCILMVAAFVPGVFIGAMRKGARQDLVAAAWLVVPLLPLAFLSFESREAPSGGDVVEWVTLMVLLWWPPALIGAAIGLGIQNRLSDSAAGRRWRAGWIMGSKRKHFGSMGTT